MRVILALTIFLLFFPPATFNAFCSEAYYIDNENVFLLYKLINWWNLSSADDSTQLCRKRIKCISKDDTQVYYNASQRTLILNITGGFADMLSVKKQCNRCFGPSFLQCTWLNKKYFGKGEAAIFQSDLPAINALVFNKIGKKEFQLIQAIEKDIEIILEGVIGGLLKDNGKIALHQAGRFLKACPDISKNQETHFPISLKIINSRTGERLVNYTSDWKK